MSHPGSAGPPVGIGVNLVSALQEPRLDRDHQAGPERQPTATPAVVRDVRVAVHGTAHTVPAELGVDLVARLRSNRARWQTKCRRSCSGFATSMPAASATSARRSAADPSCGEPTITLIAEAGDPAIDGCREVETDQVAVNEFIVVGQPVQYRVIDRRAQHLAERAGPKRGVIVDVARIPRRDPGSSCAPTRRAPEGSPQPRPER